MTSATTTASENPADQRPVPAEKRSKTSHWGSAIWNWAGTGIEISVALLLTPYLIHTLGAHRYGVWILLGSLTGYLGILDFGLRSSVGRHVAHYRAQGDIQGILNTLNTAAFTLTIISTICIAIMAGLTLMLPWLGNEKLPRELIPETQGAMIIVGLQLAVFLFTRIFDATLWGHQRFDLINMVDIPAALFRGIGSAVVIGMGQGLVGLACVTIVTTTAVGLAKIVLAFKIEPRIRPSFAHVHWSTYKELRSFGFWNMLMSLGVMARTQMSPFVIEMLLGLGFVAPFSVASRLVNMAGTLMAGGIGTVTPYAVELHANHDLERQRKLFIETGKFCAGGALYFLTLFVLLGDSLIRLWIKSDDFASAVVPLTILACGELIPLSVGMAYNTIFGMARNRSLAVVGIAECATAVVLGVLLSHEFGFSGMCAGFALSSTLWRGLFSFFQAARLIKLSIWDFLRQTVLPMLLAAVIPIAMLIAAIDTATPNTWPLLVLYGGLFSVLYITAGAIAAWGWTGLRTRILNRLTRRA
ncbi:MAG: oligosaccharide flippase family protein [Planctomycetes bacterium]|nr:oligosaccharide flippase family protein [Planctomycetota bacterium]